MAKRLTSLVMVLVNTGLMTIAFANLTEIYADSDKLIRDYNGHLLLHSSSKQTTIVLYLLLLFTSTASFLANSLAFLLGEKYYNFVGYKLIRWTTISHLILAFILLVVQLKLWSCPPKLELDQDDWSSFVEAYDFRYHNYTSRYATSPLDRIQRTLNCCGRKSPNEWTWGRKKMVAPSCCTNPTRRSLSSPSESPEHPHHGELYYCEVDGIMNLFNSDALMGCQERINARGTRCLFNLRIYLLVLMGVVFLTAKYSLIYHSDPTRPQPWRSVRGERSESTIATISRNADNVAVKEEEESAPPDYWQAIGRAAP